jgi:hypothetical protein
MACQQLPSANAGVKKGPAYETELEHNLDIVQIHFNHLCVGVQVNAQAFTIVGQTGGRVSTIGYSATALDRPLLVVLLVAAV